MGKPLNNSDINKNLKKRKDLVITMPKWLNKENIEHLLTSIMLILTFCMVVATFYQAQQSKRAIDLQYTPQISINIESNRIPVVISSNNYTRANYFEVYKNDFIGMQDFSGEFSKTSEIGIPVNISFYNLGNVGTKLERIRYDFLCDPKREKDWQVDIL